MRVAIRLGSAFLLFGVCAVYPVPSVVNPLVMAFPTGESSAADLPEELQSDRNSALSVPHPGAEVKAHPSVKNLTEWEKTCIGAYISQLKTVFHVEADGKQLCATIDGKRFCLIRKKDGFFKVEFKFLGLIPISADRLEDISISFSDLDGQKVVILHRGQEQMVLGKMVTPPELTKAWLNRTGLYEFVDTGDRKPEFEKLSLSCQNRLLVLSYKVITPKEPAKSVALKPTSDTEATILDPDGEPGETVRIVNAEGIERLQFAGYELVRKDAVAFPQTP